jgi:asparagine synthase (glutamine-hydrolysing)
MGGMLANEKTSYREMWNIPQDYDDYWAFRKYYNSDLPLITRLQVLDFHTYLPDDILTKVDRVSTAVALEARVPLLSKKIIEFLFSLPHNVRCSSDNLKGLMKTAYRDRLPDSIINRSKKGFSIPMNTWQTSVLGTAMNFHERVLQELFPETFP